MAKFIVVSLVDLAGQVHDTKMNRTKALGPLMLHRCKKAGVGIHEFDFVNDNGIPHRQRTLTRRTRARTCRSMIMVTFGWGFAAFAE